LKELGDWLSMTSYELRCTVRDRVPFNLRNREKLAMGRGGPAGDEEGKKGCSNSALLYATCEDRKNEPQSIMILGLKNYTRSPAL
jgi:hypothetical protein